MVELPDKILPCFSNEKFDRYKVDTLSSLNFFEILSDKKYCLFFAVFEENSIQCRRNFNRPDNLTSYFKMIEDSVFRRFESGVNSEDVNVFEALYIDCYFTLLNKPN